MLMLYKIPSDRISFLDVRLIKHQMYVSADDVEDLELSAAIIRLHSSATTNLQVQKFKEKTETRIFDLFVFLWKTIEDINLLLFKLILPISKECKRNLRVFYFNRERR